jgi:probable rRNA maturation factor
MRVSPFARQRRDSVLLRNHQRSQPLDSRLLRRIIRTLLVEVLDRREFQLEVHIVGAEDITRLNETYLRHRGRTDVIAFDYAEAGDTALQGEIFVCVPEAVAQARRFRTSWQRELVRYLVHALLHLTGYDDRTTAARRKMKRAEDAALLRLATEYYLDKVAGPSGSKPG